MEAEYSVDAAPLLQAATDFAYYPGKYFCIVFIYFLNFHQSTQHIIIIVTVTRFQARILTLQLRNSSTASLCPPLSSIVLLLFLSAYPPCFWFDYLFVEFSISYSALQTKSDYPGLEDALVDCLDRVFKTKYGASLIPHFMVFYVCMLLTLRSSLVLC